MSSLQSFLVICGAGILLFSFRRILKWHKGRNFPTVTDEEFLAGLGGSSHTDEMLLSQRRRVAWALSVPYLKLNPAVTRLEIEEQFGLFGDITFGWGDLVEELAGELEEAPDVVDSRISTVRDLILELASSELDYLPKAKV